MSHQSVQSVIEMLEEMSKQGESYANAEGRHGWRNPIRSDTGPLLRKEVSDRNAMRMLEVGTAHGLSALYLVQGWANLEPPGHTPPAMPSPRSVSNPLCGVRAHQKTGRRDSRFQQ